MIGKMRLKGYRRYFLKLLMSFLLIVLIPVGIMGVIWYGSVVNQEKAGFEKDESGRILEISDAIEREFVTVEFSLAILQQDIADLQSNVNDYIQKRVMTSKKLSSFIKNHKIINTIYYLDGDRTRVLSTASGSYDISDFYDTEWLRSMDNTFYSQRLPPRYSLNHSLLARVKGTSMAAVYPYRNVITIVTAGASDHLLAANIDIESLYRLIADLYQLNQGGSRFFLIGKEGEILCDTDKEGIGEQFGAHIDRSRGRTAQIAYREGFAYFIAPLRNEGLYCATAYPLKSAFVVGKGYGLYILGICSVLILLLWFIARIMARRLYKPIENLCFEIRQMPSELGRSDRSGEIETLRQAFKEMSDIYATATQREAEYRDGMLRSSFQMLLSGLITQENFFTGNERFFDGIPGHRFGIIAGRFKKVDRGLEEKALDPFYYRFSELIGNYLKATAKGVFAPTKDYGFVILYMCGTQSEFDDVRDHLIKTLSDLSEYKIFIIASDGFGPDTKIAEMTDKFLERLANACFFNAGGTFLEESEAASSPKRLLIPEKEIAARLAESAHSGDPDLTRSCLDSLRSRLVETGNHELASDACKRILANLNDTLNLCGTLDRNVLEEFSSLRTLEEMLEFLRGTSQSSIEVMHSNRTMSDYYCNEAKKYLKDNYMKYMNITDVAEHLGISYPYLSKVFRTQSEGNGKLSEYLNIIRIGKSKELLTSTNVSLERIAREVGYANVQSFQRFFKKYERMTPGEYRKLNISSRAR